MGCPMPAASHQFGAAGPGPGRRWLGLAFLVGSLPLLPWAIPASLAQTQASGPVTPPAVTAPAAQANPASADGGALRPAGRRERLWGDGRSFQSLDFVQAYAIRLKRSKYHLLIAPEDHPAPLTSLSLRFPDTFDGSLSWQSLRFCRMQTPPAVQRSRCLQRLPARFERLSAAELRITPDTPLAGDGIYGLSLVLFNPSDPGRYPLRLYVSTAESPGPSYLGTWLIPIVADVN